LQFLVIKALDPDPDSVEMLDPDSTLLAANAEYATFLGSNPSILQQSGI
jgi:hypothetical protein